MRIRVPGDKSISQRALLLAALANGESRIRGLLASADPVSTAGALREMGVVIPAFGSQVPEIRVTGRGLRGLTGPKHPLDLGNSGTGSRLLLGVLAGQPIQATVTGDASLVTRPMGRVTNPLSEMGARFIWQGTEGLLPVTVQGGELRPAKMDLPVASAQVKSAVLLAGLTGGVSVDLVEPGPSRDHTERMFIGAGVAVETEVQGQARRVRMPAPPERIDPLDLTVPGDPSSAAFFLLAAILGVTPEIEIEGVGLNPTRTGVVGLLQRMGGLVTMSPMGTEAGEPIGILGARHSELSACEVIREDVVTAIDELPIIAVAAARARGVTRITGAAELRVKETDRIHAMITNLRALGVECEELDDGMEIQGSDRPLVGRVDAFHDHRIAMVFGILGAQSGNAIEVGGRDSVEVSFPGFWELLDQVAAK